MYSIPQRVLVIYMNDSAVFLYGDITCWSLAGFNGVEKLTMTIASNVAPSEYRRSNAQPQTTII